MKKFKNKRSEALFLKGAAKGVPSDVSVRAHDRLRMIAALSDLRDLLPFPGMRLEHMKGDRKGQYSIRINKKWRICFVWTGQEAVEIEFVDYH